MDTTSIAVGGSGANIQQVEHPGQGLRTSETKVRCKNGLLSQIYSGFLCVMEYLPALIYVITIFTAASVGFAMIQRSMTPSIIHAQVETYSVRLSLFEEQIINTQLDELTSTRLGRNFIETYDECLVHGLKHANRQFRGLGFQYPHVRDQTIEWTMENCGRLHHAPRTLQLNFEVKVLTQIVRAAYKTRRIAEMFAAFAQEKVMALWADIPAKWSVKASMIGQEQPVAQKTPSFTSRTSSPPRRTSMPFGFRLLCEGASSCRLVYAPPVSRRDKVLLHKNTVTKAFTDYRKLMDLYWALNLAKSTAAWLALLLAPLELAGIIHWFVTQLSCIKATEHHLNQRRNTLRIALVSLRHYNVEELHHVACIVAQTVIMLIGYMPASTSARVSEIDLYIGLVLLMSSLSMVISCRLRLSSVAMALGHNATVYYNDFRVYCYERARIAAEHFNQLCRIVAHCLRELYFDTKAYVENSRNKDTSLYTNSNESEPEPESKGISQTVYEVSSPFGCDITSTVDEGENDTYATACSNLDSNNIFVKDEEESDGNTDSETGSESDGSITPVSDDDGWSMVNVADVYI
ncbi:hypothetical protein DE146DRAFT_793607 [Phaeosphaeria sp. MPI-PUGE-AT-0046c]|nr:hypothetical protein DE146DRAFT_793607 [Phaeosphaeria sp. MPI-PUGE-AT-0046c]